MAKKFYLMSGHSSSGGLVGIDGRALGDADNRNVLVLNMSSDDVDKSRKKGAYFEQYFYGLRADNVSVLEVGVDGGRVSDEFGKAGLVYLPGGDTKVLLRNLREGEFVERLRDFEGVISGNGAGAYALCREYLRIGHGDTEIVPSLGMVDFFIKAHYEPKFDEELKLLSEGRHIYALGDASAIRFSREGWDDIYDYIGNVWRFSNGQKECFHWREN